MREKVEPCLLGHRGELFLRCLLWGPAVGAAAGGAARGHHPKSCIPRPPVAGKGSFLNWRGCTDPSFPSLGFEPGCR